MSNALTLERPDANWAHLYPPFAARLRTLLEVVGYETQVLWGMEEGYRSPARQEWLYASGRTRPGPIVTWMEHAGRHSCGLAADCYPLREGKPDYGADRRLFLLYRSIYLTRGFDNPAWAHADLGHVQWGDPLTVVQAERWVEAGFPQGEG